MNYTIIKDKVTQKYTGYHNQYRFLLVQGDSVDDTKKKLIKLSLHYYLRTSRN